MPEEAFNILNASSQPDMHLSNSLAATEMAVSTDFSTISSDLTSEKKGKHIDVHASRDAIPISMH